jgi:hypothetical protein
VIKKTSLRGKLPNQNVNKAEELTKLSINIVSLLFFIIITERASVISFFMWVSNSCSKNVTMEL